MFLTWTLNFKLWSWMVHIGLHSTLKYKKLIWQTVFSSDSDWRRKQTVGIPVLGLCGLTVLASRSCLLTPLIAPGGRLWLPARDSDGVPEPPLSLWRDMTELLRFRSSEPAGICTSSTASTGSSCSNYFKT